MTITVRLCLILVSIITLIYMMRKIRHSKLQIEYSVFWIVFAALLIVISVFPQIIYWISGLIGVASPANLIMMTIELSQLENKVKELVQEIAIREKENEEEK